MRYEYQGIKLGDSIEKIIDLLNNKNTKLNDFGTDLIYKTGSTIEDISTRIYICLYTGIVVMIKVFDQDFCLVEDLKIGLPITNEIIEKYGLYEDDIAEDKSNDEEGLESLGRPANEYVKKRFGEDNNSKIKLSTDGIDLSNADVGEKVGDVVNESYETATFSSAFSSAGIGLIGIGGLSLSLEDNKEELNKISNFIRFPYITVKFLVNKKLTEKDKDVMHTLSPIPENMKRPIVFPFPIPSPEERIFRLPPMVPPKQETPKERWEREERIRREEQEFFNELQKPNGIPLHQERPVTIYKIQYEKGDFVEVPLDENGKVKDGFIEVVSRDGKGKGYVNKKDNGYWEKDRRAGSIFAHGGSYWKRYPSRRDAEKSEKNRITITSGIETENDKDTLKKGKGKVLR